MLATYTPAGKGVLDGINLVGVKVGVDVSVGVAVPVAVSVNVGIAVSVGGIGAALADGNGIDVAVESGKLGIGEGPIPATDRGGEAAGR